MGTESDLNILTPLSCTFFIQRNLSASWYKESPELNISGRLKSVQLNLMTDDYKLLMNILSKNMVEGVDERNVPIVAPIETRNEGKFVNASAYYSPHLHHR